MIRVIAALFLFFMPLAALEKAYLATYPQSGNHWICCIIEEATGIATGSVYCNPEFGHLPNPFPWGGYAIENGFEGTRRYPAANDTVFIKTHFPTFSATPFDLMYPYQALRIVRHPIDCFYAFYLKLTHYAPPTRNIPKPVLLQFIKSWREFQEFWDSDEACINIRFEDLQQDPYTTLKNVFKLLGLKVPEADLKRAIDRYPPTDGFLKYYDLYSYDDFMLIQEKLGDLLYLYGY